MCRKCHQKYHRTRNIKTTSMKVSRELLAFLSSKIKYKGQTYEDIIWRLIGMKEISKEDLKQIPPKYIDKLNQGKKIK